MFNSLTKITIVASVSAILSGCSPSGVANFGGATEKSAATKQLSFTYNLETETEVYFAFDRATLTSSAMRTLDQHVDWIKENPDIRFSVTGHADAVGSNAYNNRLGLRRAQNVVAYLVRNGVSHKQLVAMVSMGEEDLKVSTDAQQFLNRRVHLQVWGRLKTAVIYAVAPDGNLFPVGPDDAVNTPANVCDRGDLANVCASAVALGLLNLDAQASVSRDLALALVASGQLNSLHELNGHIGATVESSVSGVGGAAAGATGDLGDAVDGLL